MHVQVDDELKNGWWLIKTVIIPHGCLSYLDTCSNSRAKTWLMAIHVAVHISVKPSHFGWYGDSEYVDILFFKQSTIGVSAPSALDGRICAYYGFHG